MPNLQRYPDLSHACWMTVMPVTGLPHGNGLYLLGGSKDPELAAALGFRKAGWGFIYAPDCPDPDFSLSLAAVGGRVAALLPIARFIMADLSRLPVHAKLAGSDTDKGRIARLSVQRHISHSRDVSAPEAIHADRDEDLRTPHHDAGADMVSIIGHSLANVFPDISVDLNALPFACDLPNGGVVFGRPLGGAILVGIGEDPSDDRRTMTLAITEEFPGRPFYVLHAGELKSHPCALEIEDRIGAWMDAAANRLVAAPRPF